MNILVFSWRDIKHPMAGGAEQVDHEHHKGWIAAGHTVTLFSSTFEGCKYTETIDGVKIIREGNQILWVQIGAFMWYLFKRKENFDLIVDEFHGIPFFTPIFIFDKPKLAVLQEVAREVWLKNDLHYPMNLIVGYIGYFIEPFIFKFYTKIPFMVGSNSAKEEVAKEGVNKKNIYVVPHGVILYLPKKRLLREKIKTIVFLGALAKDKGIEDAIRTFALLNKKGNFQFWVIGKGGEDYLKYLKNMAKDLDVYEKITFWGFVSQQKKFELLERAHIMINPSLLEGFGLVNIESNACETPVVAYNSPGLTDSVKNGISGILLKKNVPEEMAKEVNNILENQKRLEILQKGAKKWSENFSWEKSRQKSLQLINSLV